MIVGVGVPTLDRVVALPAEPAADTSMLVESRGAHGGGQVATALVAAARLGHDARLVAAVGDDLDGRAVVAELEAEGVGTEHVRSVAGGRTASSVVLVVPDGRRTILYDPGAAVDPVLGDAERALLAAADGVALAGTHAFTREAARAARGIVLLDLDSFDTDEDDLVAACDVVIASAAYAQSRGATPQEAVRRLRELGAATAVVTLGADGAVGSSADGEHAEPARRVDVVDTTGAGDVYHGAFLVAALEGRDLAGAMRFAAAAAGLKCRAPGGRAGIPARAELDALL